MFRNMVGGLMVLVTFFGSGALLADDPTSFPEARDSQPVPDGVPSAEASRAAIRVPPGFRVSLFAAEPHVRQPIALATDHKNRLWVAENYSYAQREMNFDDSQRDRIVILEDSNGDGHFDKRTVFWDQARRLTSIEIGMGGVWALCPPHLLFLPDSDGNDLPDREPEVVLDGWNDDQVRHNIANGLRWGPDGWLYGRHGILATSYVGTPGTPSELRSRINCGIWRFHPTRRVFETVCHGTTNPWGMDWDEHGQLFFINTVIGHLWHVVPGAHFQRMYGEDFRSHLYELIPQTADHFHWDTEETWSDIRTIGVTPTTSRAGGGHAHSGMLIYQEQQWPAAYHNTVFTVNLHGLRVNNDRLERRGAGYIATHADDFLATKDPWFRGVELVADRDGNMLIADWADIGECHENDGVHRSTGRIFRVSFENAGVPGSKLPRPGESRSFYDLSRANDTTLVELQLRGNEWLVRQSRQQLQHRAAAGRDMRSVHLALKKQFDSPVAETRQLRAMWALYVTGGAEEDWLVKQLAHPSEHVRVWAVRLLSDGSHLSVSAQRAFHELATTERSGLVLQFLASSLSHMQGPQRMEIAQAIASHAEFSNDPVLPLLVWYAIEPVVVNDSRRAIDLAVVSEMPKVRQFTVRRQTLEIERRPEIADLLVARLAGLKDSSDQLDFLTGMSDALRGWRKARMPRGWQEAASVLGQSKNPEIARLVREMSIVFGDGRAIEELRQIAASTSADLESRRYAMRALTANRADGVVDLLKSLMRERDLQVDAIRGLAAFDDPQTPKILIDNFSKLHVTAQPEALATLVSRGEWAGELLAAILEKRIARDAVSLFQVRQMLSLDQETIRRTVQELWPELPQRSAEKAHQIARYQEWLTPTRLGDADLANGHRLFQRACLNCHVLYGRGGKIGPDLTGAQRTNLRYLLENIVDPSATVAENFRMSTVFLADGRVVNGVVIEQTEKTLTILTPTDRLVVAREEVDELKTSALSLMPEGQLDVLPDDHVRDLIGYLMTASGPDP